MGYKKVSNVPKVLYTIHQKRDDFLILAASAVLNIAQQNPPTPVISGNLIGSTFRTSPENGSIWIGQNADYAIYVEAKRFQMEYSVRAAKPTIDRLKARLKI